MATLDVNPFAGSDVQYDAEFESFNELSESPPHDVTATSAADSPKNMVSQCDKCTYQSQSQELYDRHITRHSMDRPFECHLCDYSGMDHSRFVGHLVFHQQSKVIQCPFCPYASYAPTMKVHMLKHRAMEVFDCSACEFSTNNPKSLVRHVEVYHSPIFKCEYCNPPNLTRMTKHSLIKHWGEVHGIREVSAETAKEAGAHWNSPAALLKPGSSCSVLCPPEVTVKLEYDQDSEDGIPNSLHAGSLNGVQSGGELVTGGFTDDDIGRTYGCAVCEFSSPLKVLLKYHILSMHTTKFSCQHCSALMTKHALIQHSKNVHGIYVYFNGKGLQKASSQSDVHVSALSHSANYPKSKTHPEEQEVPAKILRSSDQFICSVCKYSSRNRFLIEDHIGKLHHRKVFCSNCPAVMTKHALFKHAQVKHEVTLDLGNRYLIEAQSSTYSRSCFKTESEEFIELSEEDPAEIEEPNKHSEEDPDRVDAWSCSVPDDIVRYIVKKHGRFFCPICKYSVLYRSKLEGHIEKVHVKKYHCKHCPVIMSRYDLIEHSMNLHGIPMSVKSRGLKAVGEDMDEASQGMDDQGFDNGFDNDYYEPYPGFNHRGTHDEQSYVTGGAKPFACSTCDFSSHSEWSLTCHLKLMHTVKYHCNHCSAVMTKHDIIKHSLSQHGVEIRPRGPSGLREARDSESHGEVQKFPAPECTMFATDHFMGHFMDDTQNHSSPNTENGAIKTNNPFSCAICAFTAKSNWHMMKHMDSFHRTKYCCPHCPEIMTKHELIDHGWNAHGVSIKAKNRFLKVVAQDSNSSDSDGNVDYSDHEDFEYEGEHLSKEQAVPAQNHSKTACSFCGYISPNPFNVQVHVETMHVTKYQCEHCSVVMPKYDLIQHYKFKHSTVVSNRAYRFKKAAEVMDERGSANAVVKTEPVHENIPGLSMFQNKNDSSTSRKGCSFCGYKSVIPKDVRLHIERMHRLKFQCDRCPAVMVKYDLLRHNRIEHGVVLPNNHRFSQAVNMGGQESEGQMEALQLDDEYMEFDALQGSSTKNKVCSFCGYIGKSRYHVEIHVERMHTRKYHCEHCTAVMNKYDLIQHYKNLHGVTINSKGVGIHFLEVSTEEATASQNETAGSLFTGENYSAKESSKNMTNTEPESCSVCDFVTKNSLSLELHTENWHKRKYVCNDCPSVMTKHELLEHSKDVHGVTVPKLGRPSQTFKPVEEDPVEETDLDNNGTPRQTDSGFKVDGETFKCDICGFSSAHRKSILIHVINMHRKKYSCNDCSAVLSKYELTVHSKDVHGIEIPWNGRGYLFKQVTIKDTNDESQTGRSSEVSANSEILERNSDEHNSAMLPSANTVLAAGGTTQNKCTDCEFTTLYPFNLKVHVENLHTKLFCCVKCPAIKSKYELIQHYENEHNVLPGSRARFQQYHPESGQANTSSEPYPPTNTDQPNSTGVECGLTSADNDESEFVHCVGGRPRSTLKPEISGEQTDDPEIFIRVDENGEMFHCSVCGFPSKYRSNLLTHIKVLHTKKFSCDTCSNVMTKFDLIQHYKEAHNVTIPNNGKGYRFKEASDVTEQTENSDDDSESTVTHESISVERNGDGFICLFCGFASRYKKAVQTHMDAMHLKKYGCKDCSVVMSKHDLIQHYESVHSIVIPNRGRGHTAEFFRDLGFVGDENVLKIGGEFKCPLCDHSSHWKKAVLSHLESFHKKMYSCERCSVIMTKYEMIQHYETDHDVVIDRSGRGPTGRFFTEVNHVSDGMDEKIDASSSCSVQDAPSNAEMNIDDNDGSMTIIRDGGEFKCSICGFSTAFKFNLKPHFECFHKKKYSCNRCSVVTTKYGIVCHYENVHRFVIPNFGKGNLAAYCKAVSDLSEDMVSSVFAEGMVETVMDEVDGDIEGADEAVFKEGGQLSCAVCGHSFARKGSALAHVEAFHRKKYSCNRCSLITTKYDMVRHYETAHGVVIGHFGKTNAYFMAVDAVSESIDSSLFTSADGVGGGSFLDSHRIAGTDCDAGRIDITQEGEDSKCSICGHTASKKGNMEAHMEVLHKKKYSCNRCSVVLTKYEMIQHYDTDHHVEIEKSCKGLELQYFTEVDLDPEAIDAVSESAIDSARTNELGNADENVTIIREGDVFKCTICCYSSYRKGSVGVHLGSHHRKLYSCNKCSAVMTKYEMVKHYETDYAVVVPNEGLGPGGMAKYCKAVDQEPGDSNPLAHSRPESVAVSGLSNTKIETDADDGFVFKDGTDFRCSVCEFSTAAKSSAEKHMMSLHRKRFSCNRCSVVMSKYNMLRHFEVDHGVAIPYNGRGLTIQYFSPVDRDCSVSSLDQSESQHSSVTARTSEMETVADIPANEVSGAGEFKCTMCDHSTVYKSNLRVHEEALHTRKFSCNYCPLTMTKYDMMQHCENEHGIVISKSTRLTHLHFVEASQDVDDLSSSVDREPSNSVDSAAKTAFGSDEGPMVLPKNGKGLACNLCEFSTKHGYSMEAHVVNFHKRKYACDHCQAVFTKHRLIEHCKNVHGITISGYNRTIREVGSSTIKGCVNDNHSSSDCTRPSSGSSGGLSMFQCSLCDFSSKLRMHLNVHTKNMHFTKHSCNICSDVMTKHELLCHQRNLHGAIPDSTNLDPESSKEYDVSDAEAMQARNTFSCTVCDFSTKAKWYLKDHMVKYHKTEFYCLHCPAIMTKHALIKHCKNVHGAVYSSRQPFREAKDANITSSVAERSLEIGHYRGASTTSDVTSASNVASNNLQADLEITDRAECSKCDFSTPNKWYLKEHVESFHTKKYSCSQCPAVMTKHELLRHSKERHGVILKRMGKLPSAFKESRESGQSKYTTMPEFRKPKRFPCVTCSFSSFHPFGLKRHIKIHHTTKYPCQHCSVVMTRHELIKHFQNVHSMRIPENHSEDSESIGDTGSEPTFQHSGDDHTYSVPMQETTESQIINPKFQAQLQTALKTIQSSAFQPVVAIERLEIDVDDLNSTFSILGNTIAADSAVAKNPKFHDPL